MFRHIWRKLEVESLLLGGKKQEALGSLGI